MRVIFCQALEVKPGRLVGFTERPGLKFGCFCSVLIPHGHANTIYRCIHDDERLIQILVNCSGRRPGDRTLSTQPRCRDVGPRKYTQPESRGVPLASPCSTYWASAIMRGKSNGKNDRRVNTRIL